MATWHPDKAGSVAGRRPLSSRVVGARLCRNLAEQGRDERTASGIGQSAGRAVRLPLRVRRYPVEPEAISEGTPLRNQYRTVSGYQMDERRLALRGGIYDGRSWTGVVAVGKRVFCGGDDAWSTDGMYLVTDEVGTDADGEPVNIAVPAFA